MKKPPLILGFLVFFLPIIALAEELGEKKFIKEFEFRLGSGVVCGSCVMRNESSHAGLEFSSQIFADLLVPIWKSADAPVHNARWFGIGPYAKIAHLGPMPQFAGGIAAGYYFDKWQFLLNAGLAYSLGRPGADTEWWQNGQTRGTYDLGFTVRRDITDSIFLSASYNHNSNGRELGINFFGDNKTPGTNPGYDAMFFGIGVRF